MRLAVNCQLSDWFDACSEKPVCMATLQVIHKGIERALQRVLDPFAGTEETLQINGADFQQLCKTTFAYCMSVHATALNTLETPKEYFRQNRPETRKNSVFGIFSSVRFNQAINLHFPEKDHQTPEQQVAAVAMSVPGDFQCLQVFTVLEFTSFFRDYCLQHGQISLSQQFLQQNRTDAACEVGSIAVLVATVQSENYFVQRTAPVFEMSCQSCN